MKNAIIIIAVLVTSLHVQAQKPSWAWANGGSNSGTSYCFSSAHDQNGNIYITGSFINTITFGSISLISAGNEDVFIAKYSDAGNILWAKRAGGIGKDIGYAISCSKKGEVLLTGSFTADALFGTDTIKNASGSDDIFISKYDSLGQVVWVKTAGGDRPDFGRGITVARDGHIYVTGLYGRDGGSPPTHWKSGFGTDTLTSAGGDDIFIAKYNEDGNLIWVKSAGGIFTDFSTDIAIDKMNSIFIVGNFVNPWIKFDTLKLDKYSTGDVYNSSFIAKYDSSGAIVWARASGGIGVGAGGTIIASSVCVDDSGYSSISGHTINAGFRIGGFSFAPRGNDDGFVAHYDPIGNVVWAKLIGDAGDDDTYGVNVDEFANIYATGAFSGKVYFDSDSLTAIGSDLYVAKYDKNGVLAWVQKGGNGSKQPTSLCVTASDNVVVAGYYGGLTCDFGTHTITNGGAEDVFVAKLTPSANGVVTVSKDADVVVYPNPTTGTINIVSKSIGLTKLILNDQLGRIVYLQSYTKPQKNQVVSLPAQLSNGIYYLQLTSHDGAVSTNKILIQH